MTNAPFLYEGPVPDHIRDAMERASALVSAGHCVFWKFTCAGCGSRQTFGEPNALYITGGCEECGAITDLFGNPRANVGFAALLTVNHTKREPNV